MSTETHGHPQGDCSQEMIGLLPPHSIQSEQSVLGGLMLDNSKWDDVCELVDANTFYQSSHRLLFAAMSELARNEKPFDVVTISELLERDGHIDTCGGIAYMGELARNTPSASNSKRCGYRFNQAPFRGIGTYR